MSVNLVEQRQNARLIDRTGKHLEGITSPSDGWLKVLRKALGMSGLHVAKRINVTRAAIYQAERNEREGAITLKQMEKLAEAMDARFVYAVVPNGSVEDIIRRQAKNKATQLVKGADGQVTPESQSLPPIKLREKINDLATEIIRERPLGFWDN